MRVLTVLGIMTLGAGLGTAVVLVPLSTAPFASRSDWRVDWNVPAIRQMVDMLPHAPRREPAAASTGSVPSPADTVAQATPTVRVAAPVRGQDQKTFDVLSQQPGTSNTAASRADLQPWATTTVAAGDGTVRRSRPSSKPANEDQRYQLVRAIQVELARVGCYSGGTDGKWTAATKRAMGQFNDRLNATLPYDEPDLILFTLVKGHRGVACGETCPAGQQLTDGGLCRPSSVVAHADRPKVLHRLKVEQPAAAVASAPTPKPAEPALGASTVVARATETEQIVQIDQSVSVAPATSGVTVRSAPPLPGRMTIGGPVPPAQPELNRPITESPQDEKVGAAAPSNAARRSKAIEGAASAPSGQSGNGVVVRRPPPPPARAPQVSAAQPRKQRWHPNNPFWQSF